MKNLVTVYITNRNYGKYLDQSIQSVINQEYKNIFLIIIDDASSDNSKKILKNIKKNKLIKIIRNKTKKGLIKCANIAIKAAKGKYILRLDADDYLKLNAIKILQKKIANSLKAKNGFSKFFLELMKIIKFYINMPIKIKKTTQSRTNQHMEPVLLSI